MNVLEKAEKSLEYLKNYEGVARGHELQAAAGTLGRCLGALGTRPNCARHYANLLNAAVPTLLTLASHESAEVRLVGDEALNRVVVGGFAFNSYKTNAILLNQIEVSRNARWIRAALARICLGDSWLRPGIGKIRSQAQTLFPKLSEIVRTTSEIPLIIEALESNLPRILHALAEYTTDEEIHELSEALLSHAPCGEASVRRALGTCLAALCQHRETMVSTVLDMGYEKLWPTAAEDSIIIGWFCVFKAIFQHNDIKKFSENNVFAVQDYLELYQLCIHYIEQTSTEHNVQNAVLECLSVLLSKANNEYRRALLDKCPSAVRLDSRTSVKGHRRNFSYTSAVSSSSAQTSAREGEFALRGALRLGSAHRLDTPTPSLQDLHIQIPDTPDSGDEVPVNMEQLSRDVAAQLHDEDDDEEDVVMRDADLKAINIGTSSDEDVRLKYCARLLVSKFLLTGCTGQLVSDRSVRVSVKCSALSCVSEILRLCPLVATLYLDKDADTKILNYSSSTEGLDTNQDNLDEFILERNICFQDSLTESLSQDLMKSCDSTQQSKKDTKSIEKSLESELKSLKDIPSNILDSKLVASELSADTNMTISNFTTNSTDEQSTGYPMSSSGGILSSSIDLDMKFDHFGDSTNVETIKIDVKEFDRRPKKIEVESMSDDKSEETEYQHFSDLLLFEDHNDPQIRGLLRVCLGRYLVAALDLAHGDYNRWRSYSSLPKDVAEAMSIEKLMDLILKGLSDNIHSALNHTLCSLTPLCVSLSRSTHVSLVGDALAALVPVETNGYWLCRLNLVKLYETLPYQRLFMLCPKYKQHSKVVMDSLFRLLADPDQKVRTAAAHAIAQIISKIYISPRATPTTMLAEITREQSEVLSLHDDTHSLDLLRNMYFYYDLPAQMKEEAAYMDGGVLMEVVGDVTGRLMASNCKNYTQGLLETLQEICRSHPPWRHRASYSLGVTALCLHWVDARTCGVALAAAALRVARLVFPVEIHNIMRDKTNKDIFERDPQEVKEKWQYLENERVAALSEKFLQVTLKMLNVLVHLIEEVNPNVHVNKSSIALPGSPVRRKTQDPMPRRSSVTAETTEDRGSLKKRPSAPANSLKASFAGHFVNEPVYMKLYDNLRAAYSNHKINLDPKSSMFYDFLSTVLHSLAIQLELATEHEFGPITEEILYYLKVIMPLCPETAVYCVTQLLKCLFGTNMINQYQDFMSIADSDRKKEPASFYNDVMLVNSNLESESRRNSVSSNTSQKESQDPKMVEERRLLIAMESFHKNRMDRKWSTNKKELERYIRLFEPVVIQSLKMYTLQNDIGLQCAVLQLLCQLLALRVNYCMLDSDQLFIGFLLKQLDLLEQHEIPNCCELVSNIMLFLVQLSSSKHHTKQIIEIPKLIQLCDGLMAAGAQDACVAGLEPVALRVFGSLGGGTGTLGRAQQQELQATREVLFYMLQKTMHLPKVVELVSCILALCAHDGDAWRWGAQCGATLTHALGGGAPPRAPARLLARLAPHLADQPCLEHLLRTLFRAPPAQDTTPRTEKLQYLTIIMLLLRKVLVLIPESEILLSINYLKATCVAPQSIFFNVKPNTDPLNVQTVNENCANLSPDVILVRFLFKTLTYAIMEMEDFDGNVDEENCDEDNKRLYSVVVNIVVQVKHMLHLTNGCHFPLTAKTAQSILHNEQSGFNTGLYSPDENIPLDALGRVCLRAAHACPLLTAHWSHLLMRLKFVSHKYWQKLVGFSRSLPLSARAAPALHPLHLANVLAAADHAVDNGLTDVVHLTWLIVNRIHIIVSHYNEPVVQKLVEAVCSAPSACALLLQAVAARCQGYLKGEFALNTYKILSLCHESQSGALVFLICRIIGHLESSLAARFAKLAIHRCEVLKEMPVEMITSQLTKEDVQVALELLQRDKVHLRYRALVSQLNGLACSVFDLSPLTDGDGRSTNPRTVRTTEITLDWRKTQARNRCCQQDSTLPKVPKYTDLANLLSTFSLEDLTAIMACPDFDRKILDACFKVTCNTFIRDFLNVVSVQELKETEREMMRDERETARLKDEMTASIDSNKLNVVNIHVFKKSDSKESKSQFFIPMVDHEVKQNFGNLKITEEECEINVPELPKLYLASISSLDKSLAEILRLFPKQSRPLSQSENFNLSVEHTTDRYTRRCHQVFQDKLFYQEFMTIQTILTGFLPSVERMVTLIDKTDCDLLEKCIENILPSTLARNLAVFSVVSLQYLSFLISNKRVVETPVHADVSFRANMPTDNICVDHVIVVTIDNVAKALRFEEIWSELNVETQVNRIQSAICCLYAVLKYLVKDAKPLISKSHIQSRDPGPKPDIIITGDKLITLIEYWEQNFYVKRENILGMRYQKPIQSLLVSLSRLQIVSNLALIPPIAWPCVWVRARKESPELLQRVDLPLQALQDMDVLEAFLFRVNLIGWSSKKQFEEIWVGLLGALQGNGPHCAVRGITQLLCGAAPLVRGTPVHVPRHYTPLDDGMQRLRSVLVGTSAYEIFEDVNLELIPLLSDDIGGHQYAQFSTEYLKLGSDMIDEAHWRVRREVKRKRRTEIDLDSCLQLLMDVAADMLEPKAATGLAARVALLSALTHTGCVFSHSAQWTRAAALLSAAPAPHWPHAAAAALHALAQCLPVLHSQDMSAVHEKLLKSLSSSYAPLRQAALRGWLLQLSQRSRRPQREALAVLQQVLTQQLADSDRISVYAQSLYWAVLFELVETQPELVSVAVDFLLAHPRHYCADLVVRGIITCLRRRLLPKDLNKSIIDTLLDNLTQYSEQHAVQIIMVHLFSAGNKLTSPELPSDVSNMEPDVLMRTMERVTLLYKLLRRTRLPASRRVVAGALAGCLRDALPPAATLSRVLIEFVESCRESESAAPGPLRERDGRVHCCVLNCELVFEVFETSVRQEQLPILSGWIFEAMSHLLSGRVSPPLLPYCLLALLVSASANPLLRGTFPLALNIFRSGFYKCLKQDFGIFGDIFDTNVGMSFSDRRLLCVVAVHSDFTEPQLVRLKELCEENEVLDDLKQCLSVADDEGS